MMDNQRKFKRHSLISDLEILESDTNRLLGHLLDISLEGLLLISDAPIPVGMQMRLRIVLPKYIFNESHLDIEAKSVRCSPDINRDYFDTGFQFLNIDPQYQQQIKSLIDEYEI